MMAKARKASKKKAAKKRSTPKRKTRAVRAKSKAKTVKRKKARKAKKRGFVEQVVGAVSETRALREVFGVLRPVLVAESGIERTEVLLADGAGQRLCRGSVGSAASLRRLFRFNCQTARFAGRC